MKSYKSMTYTLAALVAGLMLVSQSAFAQAGGGAGGAGGGRGGGRGVLGQDATPEQTAAYGEYTAATADLTAKVAAARTELNNVIFADKVDEAAIKAKSAALAKVQEELSLAQAKAFDKSLRTKLTADQITRLKAGGQGGQRGGGRRGGAGQ